MVDVQGTLPDRAGPLYLRLGLLPLGVLDPVAQIGAVAADMVLVFFALLQAELVELLGVAYLLLRWLMLACKKNKESIKCG